MENIAFSEKLVKLRVEKGKSRVEVAEAIGVSRSAVAMYERGERIPKDSTKRKIAQFYGTTVAEIFYP